MVKTTTAAAILALVLSAGMIHFDAVKSYAASDMELRMPAVQQRLYSAKIWIMEKLLIETEGSENR
jgi:hypothetical protein